MSARVLSALYKKKINKKKTTSSVTGTMRKSGEENQPLHVTIQGNILSLHHLQLAPPLTLAGTFSEQSLVS